MFILFVLGVATFLTCCVWLGRGDRGPQLPAAERAPESLLVPARTREVGDLSAAGTAGRSS